MVPPECLFCNHVNTANSKFCSQCGSPLHLMPCVECGTINNLIARSCRSCGRKFPARPHVGPPAGRPSASGHAAAPHRAGSQVAGLAPGIEPFKESVPPVADTSGVVVPLTPVSRRREAVVALASPLTLRRRATRRRSAAIIATVAFVGLAIAGAYVYRQHVMVHEPEISAGDAEWRRGSNVGYRGSIGKQDSDAAAATVPAAAADIATPPSLPPVEKTVADVPPPERAGGQTDGVLRGSPGKTIALPANEVPTTAPVATATLGTPDKRASGRKGPDPAASGAQVATPIARPGAGERKAPRLGPCTESVAALGLCTPEPKQAAR